MQTDCKDCIFLVNGDCELNRIEKYIRNGGSLSIRNEIPLIEGRLCNANRNKEWYIKYKDNYLEQLSKEIAVQYSVIINTYTYYKVEEIIGIIQKQSIKPTDIHIIYHADNLSQFMGPMNLLLSDMKIPWKVRLPTQEAKYKHEFVDEILNTENTLSPYIAFFDDGSFFRRDNFIGKINSLINDDLKQYMLFKDFGFIFTTKDLARMFKLDELEREVTDAGLFDQICHI